MFVERLRLGILDLSKVCAAHSPLQVGQGYKEQGDQEVAYDRSRFAVMIHSVPIPGPGPDAKEVAIEDHARMLDLVHRAKALCANLFITESDSMFYSGFSQKWEHWVELIGA